MENEDKEDTDDALSRFVPEKSKERYLKEYEAFQEWKKGSKITVISEDALLRFFHQKSEILKSSSLWSRYSMIKSTLRLYENIDISKYTKLTSFLKQKSIGYKAKKAKTLTREQLNEFLVKAPDLNYLMIKVAAVIGIAGACSREELYKICIDDVEEHESFLVIYLRHTKTSKPRAFTIVDDDVISQTDILKKYIALRPKTVTHKKLFLFYNRGKCSVQPVGINTFAKIPKVIAQFLNLPDVNHYTGHCFRRTSAMLLADNGADLLTLKRHGGWGSSAVARSFIRDSLINKRKIVCEKKSSSFSKNETDVDSLTHNSDETDRQGRSKSIQEHQKRKDYIQGTGTDDEDNFSKKPKHLESSDSRMVKTISEIDDEEHCTQSENIFLRNDIDDVHYILDSEIKEEYEDTLETDTHDTQQCEVENNHEVLQEYRHISNTELKTPVFERLSREAICDPATTMFFKSIAITVSALPPILRAKAKAEVMSIISRFEVQALSSKEALPVQNTVLPYSSPISNMLSDKTDSTFSSEHFSDNS